MSAILTKYPPDAIKKKDKENFIVSDYGFLVSGALGTGHRV
jgi:hypothetical protein